MEIGELLRDRYRIEETLGKGGMGAVYRAVDESLGVQVAVKENLFTDQDSVRQFKREATILANLRHPNLPRVTDHFVIEGEGQYLVMDYIEGEDLRARLKRIGALPEKEIIVLGAAISDALSYMHNLDPPVLHRDIKPSNIKVTPQGQVYLVDFGLAKEFKEGQQTTTAARGLSPGYSSPEQYGAARTDARSDIFSLGATLYTMLAGSPPADGLSRALQQAELKPIHEVNPEVSSEVVGVIEKALAIQPTDRFQSAGAFKGALLVASDTVQREVAAGRASIAPPPAIESDATLKAEAIGLGPPPVVTRPARSRLPIILMGVFLVLILVLGAVGAYLLFPDIGEQVLALFSGGGQATEMVLRPSPTSRPTDRPSRPTLTEAVVALPTATQTLPVATDEPAGPVTTPLGGGENGQVAFASDRSGKPQIWLVDLDGNNLTQLTDESGGACQPTWSPDGQRLAYISPCDQNLDRYPGAGIYIMNADGTGWMPVPSTSGGDYDPAWSPDGSKIAYTSLRTDGRAQIWIYNLETGETGPFTQSVTTNFQPAWSPDGENIVFVSTREGLTKLYFMNISGPPVRDFSRSDDYKNTHPVWSPDGELILFTQNSSAEPIPWLAAAAWENGAEIRGFNEFRVTTQPLLPVREADYSPDGNWIVAESYPDGTNHDIYIMTSSGGRFHAVTTDPAYDFDPAWRP